MQGITRLILSIIFVVIYSALHAQSQADTTVIKELEQKLRVALIKGDTATLFHYWAPEFVVNNPGNHVSPLDRVKVFIRTGLMDYSDFDLVIDKVTIIDNIALSMGTEVVKPQRRTDDAGKTVTRRYTDVWMKRNNGWQMVGRQATVTAVK